jgi:protein-S-isoprenylcysteine O-methyltransferase Ste14
MKRFFNTVYMLGLLAEMVIRLPYERQRQQTRMAVEHVTAKERSLIGLLFFGMVFLPAVYVFTPWLRRADYRLAPTTHRRRGMLGSILLVCAVWVFGRAHHDLGQNWSPSLELREEHRLVTQGIYRYIRHPMYASQWLWGIAQALLLPNWIAGWASLVLFLPLYIERVPHEEQMLLDQFGDAYRVYMQQTGRVLPRV